MDSTFSDYAPGTYLAEELEARGIEQNQFAKMIEMSEEQFGRLIRGESKILISTAAKLERLLGTSFMMWLNLDRVYQSKKKGGE